MSESGNMWQLDPANGVGAPFYIRKNQILVGRAETNDLVIKNSAASSVHACITLTDTEVQLVDMGSTNGTFVNGKQIEKANLGPEDIITFGEVKYILRPRMATGTTKLNLNALDGFRDSTAKINLDSVGFKKEGDSSSSKKLQGRKGHVPGMEVVLDPVEEDLTKTHIIGSEELAKEKAKKEAISKVMGGKLPVAKKDVTGASAGDIAPPPITVDHSDDLRELEELLNGPDVAPDAKNRKISSEKEVFTLLDIDPELLYSEFISEDKNEVYPIFNYDINRVSVEIMVLVRDIVLSVDYINMAKNAKIMAVGKGKSSTKIVLDSFNSRQKQLFLTIKNGKLEVSPLKGFSSLYFYVNGKIVKDNREVSTLIQGDFVQFLSDQVKVFIRIVSSPPQITPPPFLGRDSALKKYVYPLLALGLVAAILLLTMPVDRTINKKKSAERIAKILIKRRKPKPRKTPRPVSHRPDKKEKVTKESDAAKPIQEKAADVKTVKKAPKKRKAVTRKKSRKVVARKRTKPKPKPVFKKMNFKNTLTTLNQKGGKIKAKAFKFNIGGTLGLADSKSMKVGKVSMAKIEGKLDSLLKGQKKLSTVTGASGIASKKGFAFPKVFRKTVVLGSMDPDEVREILDEYIPLFRHCYDQELERQDNKIKGTMNLDFIIGASGRVTRATIKVKKMKFSTVGKKCVQNVLKGIRFPKPKGGGTVQIKQPLNFESID